MSNPLNVYNNEIVYLSYPILKPDNQKFDFEKISFFSLEIKIGGKTKLWMPQNHKSGQKQ